MHAVSWLCVISSVLAGDPPGSRTDEAIGLEISESCLRASDSVSYSKHVAPILFRRCVTCHRPGEVAPFALTSYENTVAWAETIREVVEQRRMPPWLANPAHGSFANEARLTDDELATIVRWIEIGTPEGNRADLPPLPKFTDGWRIPEPDLVLEMPQPFTIPAKGTVNYQYFTIDQSFAEDRWVRAAEARPGNRAVVHHVVLLVQAPGDRPVRETGGLGSELLATFAPGMPPTVLGDGLAKLVPAGAKLVLQVHYTPNGTEQTDRSKVGLVFAEPRSVRKRVRGAFALNFQFRIPPGAKNYRVEADHKFGQDTLLVSLFPHMHLRGKSFQFNAQYPDGHQEILLDVPRWDFNWQSQYVLAEPKSIPEGTVLHCIAHFDNSAENPANPDPNTAVMFGEQTWQEMMVGYFDATLADQDLTLGGPEVAKQERGEFDVLFRYKPNEPAKAVYLAGTFNEWKPVAHAMDGPDNDGWFGTRIKLPAGEHEYKFVIDGTKWRQDPGNYRQTGFYNNSVLVLAGESAASVANCKSIDIQPQANHELSKDFASIVDGNNLAELPTGEDNQVQRWRERATLAPLARRCTGVAFSPDGKILVTVGGELTDASVFQLWSVAFSPDGKKIAAGGRSPDGGIARVWDVATGAWTNLPGHKEMVWSVVFAPGGRVLATGDTNDGSVKLWNVQQEKEQAVLKAFKGAIFSLSFSPDGRQLVVGGTDGGAGVVKWWILENPK